MEKLRFADRCKTYCERRFAEGADKVSLRELRDAMGKEYHYAPEVLKALVQIWAEDKEVNGGYECIEGYILKE